MARLLYLFFIFLFASALSSQPAAAAAGPKTPMPANLQGAPATNTVDGAQAEGPKPVPAGPLTILVSDQAKALSPVALSHLKSTVANAAGASGIRFDVYIVKSLDGQIGNTVVDKKATEQGLSVGRDSVLLLISTQEKQGWLWASPKLDETMGDGTRQAILDYIVEPNLRQGNVARAAEDGTRALGMALAGAYKAPAQPQILADGGDIGAMLGAIPSGALPGLITAVVVAMLVGGAGSIGGGGGGGYGGGYGGRSGPNILGRWV